ncbi:chitinase (CHT1) [Plasmodium ovale curtisi]|uniref:Chitinase (CHT1) n=1 Tax=Plasmodium ovale curtisi TaxID=864141 RepID=A0A1A8VNA3_PLAOA|nr:chitinase (CHT1) [Plasmodium ovale curtisi]
MLYSAYSIGLKGSNSNTKDNLLDINWNSANKIQLKKSQKYSSRSEASCSNSKKFVCKTEYICSNGTVGESCAGGESETEGGNGNETGGGNGNETEGGNGNETGGGNGNETEGGNGNETEGGNGNETEGGNGNETEGGNGTSGNHDRKPPKEILEEYKKKKQGIIAGYYGSWNSQGDRAKEMTDSNPMVSVLYIAFARINMFYDVSRPFNGKQKFLLRKHGLEYETYGMMLNGIRRIRKARPDIILLLSLGGETYMIDITKDIDYIQQIVKLVSDFDLDGVDIDWEPHGSFNNLNELSFSNYYIKLINLIRSKIPEEKLISISGSSNAALSCVSVNETFCKDEESPYNSNYLSQQMDKNEELYKAATMLSTGTFVNIFNTVKGKIDLVFIQTYNLETTDPSIMVDMYLSHLYFGLKYNITVLLGFSIEHNRGGFSPENKELVELVAKTIHDENHKYSRADGIGIWHLFMKEQAPTGTYDVESFLSNVWKNLNPDVQLPKDIVITQNPDDCSTVDEYIPGLVVPKIGVYFKHNDAIWVTRSYATHAPGIDRYEWNLVKVCYDKICNDKAAHYYNTDYENGSIVIWKEKAYSIKWWQAGPPEGAALESYEEINPSDCPGLAEWNKRHPHKPIEEDVPYEQEADLPL